MEYRILGPFEVVEEGRPVDLPAGRARELLALLLLRANEVVSVDRCVEELWGERAPATAVKAVQNAVSLLRKAIGDDRLATHGPGYVLRTNGDALDADRFAELLADARRASETGRSDRAAAVLHDALALWRGPPLADFAYHSFAQAEIARLEELRLEALEERLEAELACGRHAELVPELEQLTREHPLRERLRAHHMLSLYRAGRQADALEVYQHIRGRLRDELGLEPGRALQDLERAILTQDPALEAPAPPPRVVLRARGGWAVAAGAALLVAAGGATAWQLVGGGRPVGLASVSPNAVGLVEASGRRIAGQIAIPGRPGPMVTADGTVWVAGELNRTLTAFSPTTREVKHVVALGIAPSAVAATADAVWVADLRGRRLVAVDPAYGEAARPVAVPRAPPGPVREAPARASLAATAGSLWLTDGSARLLRLDAATGRATQAIDLGLPLDAVAASGRTVWVASGPAATVVAVDARTGRITSRTPIVGRIDAVSPFPIDVAVGDGFVWTVNAGTATVTKLDPQTRGVAATIPIGVGRTPTRLAVGSGAAWVANSGDGTLARVDAQSNEVEIVRVGNSAAGVAASAEGVWVAVQPGEGSSASSALTAAPASPHALPLSSCSAVYFDGRGAPDLLIASDLPLQGFIAESTAHLSTAMRVALAERGFRAGRFTVGYQSCDDSKPQSHEMSPARCAANARAYARTRKVVGVIAPLYSGCTQIELPIVNAAPGGPVAMASFTNTYIGLTKPSGERGEPGRYYPSGRRNYVRLLAADDAQAAAAALFARRHGADAVFLLEDGSTYGRGLAAAFRRGATGSGMRVVGTGRFAAAATYVQLARKARTRGADTIFIAGALDPGTTLLTDLRAALPDAMVIGGDGLQTILKQPDRFGRAAEGVFFTNPGPPVERLGPPARRFERRLRAEAHGDPLPHAFYAAQAVHVLLDAIARSDGTRSSVTAALRELRVENGIMGDFAFTDSGDTTPSTISVFEWKDGRAWLREVVTPQT